MSEIPPKQPVNGTASAHVESAYGVPPLSHADPAHDVDATGALVSLHNAATESGVDSFPVLKAFQEHLESERQRASRRVALVTSLFAGIIVALVAFFIFAGFVVFNYMKEREDKLWQRMSMQTTAPGLQAPDPVAATEAKPAAWEQELKKMGAALADLKRDNQKLREKLDVVPAETPAMPDVRPVAKLPPSPSVEVAKTESPVADAVPPSDAKVKADPLAQPQAAVRQAPPPDSVVAAPKLAPLDIPVGVKAPRPPAGYADSQIYLQPGGAGVPIPWRVYIPSP